MLCDAAVCDDAKHHGPMSNTAEPWQWRCYNPVKCSYHNPSDSTSHPWERNLNFPVHHSPVFVSSTVHNDILSTGKPHNKKFQKLNWNPWRGLNNWQYVTGCNAHTQCYEVYIYIYIYLLFAHIILQWCGADRTCKLQLPTSQLRNMNSRDDNFSRSQNCNTFAQGITNLIWI